METRPRQRSASTAPLSDIALTVDTDGRIIEFEPGMASSLGYEVEQLLGRSCLRMLHRAAHGEVRALGRRLLFGELAETPLVLGVRHGDGGMVDVKMVVDLRRGLDGTPAFFQVRMVEIAPFRAPAPGSGARSDDASLVFEHAPRGQAFMTMDGGLTRVNPAFDRALGGTPDQRVGGNLRSYVHPDDLNVLKTTLGDLPESDEATAMACLRLIRHDGTVLWASLLCGLVRDAQGNVLGAVVQCDEMRENTVRDSELAELTEALVGSNRLLRKISMYAEAKEARYRALVESLPEMAVLVHDRDHRLIEAIGSAVSECGCGSPESIGRRPIDYLDPRDATAIDGMIEAALSGVSNSRELHFHGTETERIVDVVPLGAGSDGLPEGALVVCRDIGRLKEREREIVAAEARWRAAFDDAPVGMVELDVTGIVRHANAAFLGLVDLSMDEVGGVAFVDFLRPEDRPEVAASFEVLALNATLFGDVERRIRVANGVERLVVLRARRLAATDNSPERLLVHVLDVTLQHEQSELLNQVRSRFAALVEQSSDAILLVDAEGYLLYASPAFAPLTGHSASEALGMDLLDLMHPQDRSALDAQLQRLVAERESLIVFDCRLLHRERGWRNVEVRASNRLDDPAIGGVVVNARDVTDRVQATARLAHLAMHDILTGLPNRAHLTVLLEKALARSERTGRKCAMIFMDLDGFKAVNDSYGHSAGDHLLIAVAGRLLQVVRPADTVARLGGDEFVVLIVDLADATDALSLAERIRGSLAEPFDLPSGRVAITASLGVALSDDRDAEALLQRADVALYWSKREGGNRWSRYE